MVWCLARPRAGKKQGKQSKKGAEAGKQHNKAPAGCKHCLGVRIGSTGTIDMGPTDPARRFGQEWDRKTLRPKYPPCAHGRIDGNGKSAAFMFADMSDSSMSDETSSSVTGSSYGTIELARNAARIDVESVTDADSHD